MQLDKTFTKTIDLKLFEGKKKIPLCHNLKKKLRNSIAEQYFETKKILLNIPWMLHNDLQTSELINELINTYSLIDDILQITN